MNLFANWKTTLLGLAAVAAALSGGLTALSGGDMIEAWKDFGVLSAGLAAVFAKDA